MTYLFEVLHVAQGVRGDGVDHTAGQGQNLYVPEQGEGQFTHLGDPVTVQEQLLKLVEELEVGGDGSQVVGRQVHDLQTVAVPRREEVDVPQPATR